MKTGDNMPEITITTLFLGTILESMKGNAPWAVAISGLRHIIKHLKDEKIINDDLQKSICKSFIVGLETICEDCLVHFRRNRQDGFYDVKVNRWLDRYNRHIGYV